MGQEEQEDGNCALLQSHVQDQCEYVLGELSQAVEVQVRHDQNCKAQNCKAMKCINASYNSFSQAHFRSEDAAQKGC